MRAIKGSSCAGNSKHEGRKSVHTLVVVASVWVAINGTEDRVAGAQVSYVGEGVDEEGETSDEAETDNTLVRSLSRHMAEHMPRRDPEDYMKELPNALHVISMHQFPPELPGSLPAPPRRE